MKALPFKIPSLKNESIKVDRDVLEQFYPHFHTHEELQLIWIIKGEGTAFIGDQILPFKGDEVFLLSSNLPHVFKSEPHHKRAESLSIYFPSKIFESNRNLQEFEAIIQFLDRFNQGIFFDSSNSDSLKNRMNNLEHSKGLQRILQLVELMDFIANQQTHNYIASSQYASPKADDGEKISQVIEYLYSNYSESIRLENVANIANLTPQAFCRYFKRHTRKSMVQFLNQIRIGKVCGWLQENKFTITESCYQAGFNNISNFNRQFKTITGYTPSGYIAKQKTLTN